MSAEAGHAPSRVYLARDGSLHLNGAAVYDSNENDIATQLDQKRPVVTKTDDYTLTAADSGKVFVMNAGDKVFTLPATVNGLEYTLVAGTTSVTTGLSVSPNAADKIIGNGFTAADDKDAINTQGTEKVGDMLRVVGDGSAGWYITGVVGTWAREA